jgi:hypothetical protein
VRVPVLRGVGTAISIFRVADQRAFNAITAPASMMSDSKTKAINPLSADRPTGAGFEDVQDCFNEHGHWRNSVTLK